jgi:hypothetical protein
MEFIKKIAKVLEETNRQECIKESQNLQVNNFKSKRLNLRNLNLTLSDINQITDILEQVKNSKNETIESISFSYNSIGDNGIALIVNSLPISINEIGLVDCGIEDAGALEILNWMKKATQLKMICIEENNFSTEVNSKFKTFKKSNPHITIIT